MPIATKLNTDGALEAALLSGQHGVSYFKNIEECLMQLKGESQGLPQQCSEEMMRKLITVAQEQLPCQKFWQVEVMVSVIKHIASQSEEDQCGGLDILMNNGLFEILGFVFDESRRHISPGGSKSSPEADHLMEVLLETINDVAEYSQEARKAAVESFSTRLIKLVIDAKKSFHSRMEAERTLNLLLEGCDDDVSEEIIKNPSTERLLRYLAEYLPMAGDFEMQIAVTETLARLVKKSERSTYSAIWFKADATRRAFLDIQDQQFDADCRKFLNLLNASGPERSLFSYPCTKAYLGDTELRSPRDENLREFWVDFNSASQSITMYVADEDTATEEDGGLWETVCFQRDKVKSYCITGDAEGAKIELTLTEPPQTFLPFCRSDKKLAAIFFDPGTDLHEASACSLGPEKLTVIKETPTRKSSMTKMNICVNQANSTSWTFSNEPKSFHDGYVDQDTAGHSNGQPHNAPSRNENETQRPCDVTSTPKVPLETQAPHGLKGTPKIKKVSVPLNPIGTPTMSSFYSTASATVSSSTAKSTHGKPGNQGSTQPRTPVGHHGSTKKVKTPLQITVADKPNTSTTGNSNQVQVNPRSKPGSGKKVSVSVVTPPINGQLQEATANVSKSKSSEPKRERDGAGEKPPGDQGRIITLPDGRESSHGRKALVQDENKKIDGKTKADMVVRKDIDASKITAENESPASDEAPSGKGKAGKPSKGDETDKMRSDGKPKRKSKKMPSPASQDITTIPDTQSTTATINKEPSPCSEAPQQDGKKGTSRSTDKKASSESSGNKKGRKTAGQASNEVLTAIPDIQSTTIDVPTEPLLPIGAPQQEGKRAASEPSGKKKKAKKPVGQAKNETQTTIKRVTRSSSQHSSGEKNVRALSTLPEPLVPSSKSRAGKKFKLYANESMLMDGDGSEADEAGQGRSKASRVSKEKENTKKAAAKEKDVPQNPAPEEIEAQQHPDIEEVIPQDKGKRKKARGKGKQQAVEESKSKMTNEKKLSQPEDIDQLSEEPPTSKKKETQSKPKQSEEETKSKKKKDKKSSKSDEVHPQSKKNAHKLNSKTSKDKRHANAVAEMVDQLVIEDNLSQDFVVPKKTARGKPTLGAVSGTKHPLEDLMNEPDENEREEMKKAGGNAKEAKLSSEQFMNSPDPCDREERQKTKGKQTRPPTQKLINEPHPSELEERSRKLPEMDEREAARALAVENAEFVIPSSAPEERYSDIVPASQPTEMMTTSFRRSGRFPSPLLSDITEESTLTRSTQSRGSKGSNQRGTLSYSTITDVEFPIVKSASKPETAKADSTSNLVVDKDPYAFEDSSNASSVPAKAKQPQKKGGAGDTKRMATGRRTMRGQDKAEDEMEDEIIVSQELVVEDDSQEDFMANSHRFGGSWRNGAAKDQNKAVKSGKKTPTKKPKENTKHDGSGDGSLHRGHHSGDGHQDESKDHHHTSGRKRMKGKLDCDDVYVQQISKEGERNAKCVKALERRAEEQEYPDIEVARDVSTAVEDYCDTDINDFMKSVMKSLPSNKNKKEFLARAKRTSDEKQTRSPSSKHVDSDQMQHEQNSHLESLDEQFEEEPRSATKKRDKKRRSKSDKDQEPSPNRQPVDKATKKSQKDARNKKKRPQVEHRATSMNEESVTEGEMSMDDMLDAHMSSILGHSYSNDADEQKNKSPEKGESKTASSMKRDELIADDNDFPSESDVDSEVLLRAEDSIVRRTKLMVAVEQSSQTLSDDDGETVSSVDELEERDTSGRKSRHSKEDDREHSGRKSRHGEADDARDASVKQKRKSEKGFQDETSKPKAAKHLDSDPPSVQSSKQRKKGKSQEANHLASKDAKGSRDKSSTKALPDKTGVRENDSRNSFREEKTKGQRDNRSTGILKEMNKLKETFSTKDMKVKKTKEGPVAGSSRDVQVKQAKTKEKRDTRTHYGSQIQDSDSEDVYEDMEVPSLPVPDDTSTVVSVESFSNLCKDLLKSSGRGVASSRGRRKVIKVDYKEPTSSESGSSVHTDLQTPVQKGKQKSKTPVTDVYEYTEENSASLRTSIAEDTTSECSWLADKPKHKVSTYSKARANIFGFGKIAKNLETVQKQMSHQSKVKNVNAPKKRKSKEVEEEVEENLILYFGDEFQEEGKKKRKKKQKKDTQETILQQSGTLLGREESSDDVPVQSKEKKKSGCRRSLIERMPVESSQNSFNASQDSIDIDDRQNVEQDEEEEEEEGVELPLPTTPSLTIESVNSQISGWTTPGSVIRTPKQVSFVDELASECSSDEDGISDALHYNCPKSGPSKLKRPTQSALKRKYAEILVEEESDADNDDDLAIPDINDLDVDGIISERDDSSRGSRGSRRSKEEMVNLSLKENSLLQPKNLFHDLTSAVESSGSEHSGETGEELQDGISDNSVTSSWGQHLDLPAMQMPEIFGMVRNKMKQKMMIKKSHTQKLTESAIQSTQNQMNKIFLELHKARRKGQSDFQHKLLSEVVGIESCLEKLTQVQGQNEQVIKQFKRKSTQHVEQHLQRVQQLHTSFLERSDSLGDSMVETVQQILQKEIQNMQQKLMKNMQQEQMQKTMQSLFFMR